MSRLALPALLIALNACASGPCTETRPKVIDRGRPPLYTKAEVEAHAEGSVHVTLEIDENGNVVHAKVDQPLGNGLDETVLTSVRSWRFKPATQCGKPVPSEYRIAMNFRIKD
jgi:protein TonB